VSKQFWAIIAVIVLVFVGIFAFGGNKSNKSGAGGNKSALTQNIQGKGTTGVTLTEYGDFQCPYCQQYAPTVQAVQAQYGDKIKFQFRNYPLVSLHKNAFAAARAGQAAALQGKFWEMHDILYQTSNWQVWTQAGDPTTYFDQFAKALGLNVAQFKSDFASSKVNDAVNADIAEGTKLGITGTPTFFINGKKTDLANSQEAFQTQIDAAIAKSSAPKQ